MQSLTLRHGSSSLHVADFGGAGPTILLVHGLGGSHANFVTFAADLARDARVVAVDLPGFGLSPPSGGGDLGAHVAAVRRVLRAIRDREIEGASLPVSIVGNSMGGAVSILLAAEDASAIEKLVLVCPAVPQPDVRALSPRFTMLLGASMLPGYGALFQRRLRAAGPAALVHEMLALTCADKKRVARADVERMIQVAETRMAFDWAGEAFSQAARSIVLTLLRRRAFQDAMRAIRVPVLHVQGDRDRLVPVTSARAANMICPHWSLEIFDGVGHVPQLEVPDRLAASVRRFLSAPHARVA